MIDKKKKENIIKADPRIHLEELKKVEDKILSKIKKLDSELKLQLTELKITRDLIEESFNEVKEHDKEEFVSASKNLNKEIEKLENVIDDFKESKKDMNIEDLNNPYEINAYSLKQATSYETIERLYDLASKNKWTYNEAQEFVKIKYNVVKALEKDFNPIVGNRLNSVYQAILHVNEVKPETTKYEFRNTINDNNMGNLEKNVIKYDAKKDKIDLKKEYKVDLPKFDFEDKKEVKKYQIEK